MTRQKPFCAVIVAVSLMFATAGCENQSATPEGAAPSASALTAPAIPISPAAPVPGTQAPIVALPAKATLKLSQLQPSVVKPASAQPTRPLSPQATDALADAEKALAENDLTRAIERLERAASFDPTNPKVRRSLAMAYFSRQDFGKALESLQAAIKAAPDDLESQLMLGRLLAAQRRDTDAVIAYRTALVTSQASPDNPMTAEAMLRLAMVLQENGYWTASLEAYDTLSQWFDKYGRSYASRQILRDLALRPEKLQTMRGRLLMQLNRPSEAVGPLEKSFETNHTDLSTARLLLEALIATRQYPKAEKLLVDLTSESSQAAQLSMLAENLCRSAGDPEMPVRIWNAFLKKNQINPGLAVALAKISERLGKPDKARTILQSVLQAMPGNMPTANALAGVLAREKKYSDALQVLADVVRHDPDNASQIEEGIGQIVAAGANKAVAPPSTGSSRPTTGQVGDFAWLYVVGQLQEALGKDDAIQYYDQSAAANKTFMPAVEAQVDWYLSKNKADQAQKIAAALPKGYFADYLSGKIKLYLNKPADAVTALEASRKANAKFVPAALALADAYLRQQQTDNAITALFSAIEADPDNVQAYRRLFEVLVLTRQYSDAQAVVGRFIERQPQNIRGMIMLAELNLANNQRPTAVRIIQQLVDQAPDNPEVNLLAARAELAAVPGMLAKPQFERAIGFVDAALKQDPRNLYILRLKADLLAQPGHFDEAAAVWKQAYDISNRDDYGKSYAATLMLAGRYDQAASVLESMVARSTDVALRQALVESMTHLDGGWQKAADLLLKWIKEDNDNERKSWYHARLIKVATEGNAKKPGSVKLDEVQKALDDWMPSADLETKQAIARQKVRFYVMAGQYDKANQSAAAAEGSDEIKSQSQQSLSDALVFAKQFDRAQAVLDKAIESEKNPEIRDRLRALKISAYVDAGNYDAAVKYASSGTWQDSKMPRIVLIETLTMAKQYDRALKLVEGYLSTMPKPTTRTAMPSTPPSLSEVDLGDFLRTAQVRLLLFKERFADALGLADEALNFSPDNTELLNLKSSALTELGRHEESIKALEKVYNIKPDDPGANNNLAYMYIERGVQLEKAERMLRKALNDRPNEASFMDSLGWAMYRQGRVHEAAAVLREVVLSGEEDSLHPVIFDHVGDAYWRLGWTEEAVKFWNKAVELARKEGPTSSEIRQVAASASAKAKAAGQKKSPEVAPFAPPPASAPASAPSTSKPAK